MPASKIKITKNDILLFLTNELEGEKAAYISNVDEKLAGELNLVVDKEIKETLAKYRQVDSVLSNAADASFEMPISLENKINAIIASKTKIQKKTTSGIFDKVTAFFNAANLWSLLGGGAAATLGMLSIIQIQPDLLIDRASMREVGTVYRGGEILSQITDECNFSENSRWNVTEEFLYKIQVCDSQGTQSTILSGETVSVGDEFSILILPTRDLDLSVTYIPEHGESIFLANQKELRQGIILTLPDQSIMKDQKYIFSDPAGNDLINFETSSGYNHQIKINVE